MLFQSSSTVATQASPISSSLSQCSTSQNCNFDSMVDSLSSTVEYCNFCYALSSSNSKPLIRCSDCQKVLYCDIEHKVTKNITCLIESSIFKV